MGFPSFLWGGEPGRCKMIMGKSELDLMMEKGRNFHGIEANIGSFSISGIVLLSVID